MLYGVVDTLGREMGMAKVNVYGRLDGKCSLCEAAKEKLHLLGVKFTAYELSDFTKLHDGWRDDESVEVTATYNEIDTYPVIVIDGKGMSYSQAMKTLKALMPKAVPAEPVRMFEFQPVERELVAVG